MRTGTAATRQTVSQAWSPVLTAAGVEGQELGRQILADANIDGVTVVPTMDGAADVVTEIAEKLTAITGEHGADGEGHGEGGH